MRHCRGHNCLIVHFYFDGFYETDRRLYWDNYCWFDNQFIMGNLCTKIVNSSDIDVLDCTTKDDSYEYLMPRGQIIVQIDEKYNIPLLILDFDGCVPKYVRLWPQSPVQRNQFLHLERTPLSCLEGSVVSESFDDGYDAVF